MYMSILLKISILHMLPISYMFQEGEEVNEQAHLLARATQVTLTFHQTLQVLLQDIEVEGEGVEKRKEGEGWKTGI